MKLSRSFKYDPTGSRKSQQSGRSSVLVWAVLAIIIFALLLASLAILTRPPTPAALPIPNPNAYRQMEQLGARVEAVPMDSIGECDQETLKAFLDANRSILEELDTVLQNDSVVPMDYSSGDFARQIEGLGEIRQVMRVLHADAALASLDNQPFEAANAYVKLLTAARKIQHGGLYLHMQVAGAYERVGWPSLGELAPKLSTEEKEQVTWQLQSLVPRDNDFADRETALAAKGLGRVRLFLMQAQVAAESDRNQAIIAELEVLEKAAMSQLSP